MATNTENAGKQKALNIVLNQIEKTFGKGPIIGLAIVTRRREEPIPKGQPKRD